MKRDANSGGPSLATPEAVNLSAKSGGQMSRTTKDIILLVVITVFLASILYQCAALTKTAALVPRLISIAGLVLCGIQLVTEFKKRKREKSNGETEARRRVQLRWYFLLGLIILYMICLYLIGFVPSALLFLFVTPYIMKQKKITLNAIVAVVATTVLYFTFIKVFDVRLPAGILSGYFY